MPDLWAVVVGGAIGITGALASAVLAYRLDRKRRLDEGQRSIRKLLGRQAAMELSLEGHTIQALQQKYLEMVAGFEDELKSHPELLDLTEGFLETMVDDMARVHAEEHKLQAELDRLKAKNDRLKAQLDLLQERQEESGSLEPEGE